MKRILCALFFMFFLFASESSAQGTRFGDTAPVIQQPASGGPIIAVGNDIIKVCAHPAINVPCTNLATTYTDITLGTPCSSSTQIVLANTSSCVGTTDGVGNWGVWVAAGAYDYTVTFPGGVSAGPFPFTTGGTGGGGGNSLPVTQLAVGNGAGQPLVGFSALTYVNTPTPAITIGGTNNGVSVLGNSSSTSASSLQIFGGNGTSNTTPAFLELCESPAAPFCTFLYPCNSGLLCFSTTTPAADSTQNVSINFSNGTATLGTSAISATTCATAVTVSAPGILATDSITWSFNAAPSGAYTTGLTVTSYVTANNVNFQICNPTAGSLTPPAATLNWAVRH